jgi:hypothetical protein
LLFLTGSAGIPARPVLGLQRQAEGLPKTRHSIVAGGKPVINPLDKGKAGAMT